MPFIAEIIVRETKTIGDYYKTKKVIVFVNIYTRKKL